MFQSPRRRDQGRQQRLGRGLQLPLPDAHLSVSAFQAMPARRSIPKSTQAAAADVLRRFGADLRKARIAAGISQSELGAIVGVSQGYVSKVELGQQNLTATMMVELAHAAREDVTIRLGAKSNPRAKARGGSGNLLLRNMH